MTHPQTVTLKRDVQAAIVPVGTPVTLQAGEEARITQALGGSCTVIVNGNMFRIEARDADALGIEVGTETQSGSGAPRPADAVEKAVWDTLKTCYDPEIPVNIVDLGLIYDCVVTPIGAGPTCRVQVKMTLTAPGCGMGPVIQQEAQQKILAIPEVDESEVDLVWDPPWTQNMLSDAAKLELGLM